MRNSESQVGSKLGLEPRGALKHQSFDYGRAERPDIWAVGDFDEQAPLPRRGKGQRCKDPIRVKPNVILCVVRRPIELDIGHEERH
jgi:hypothetical protein